MAETYWQYAGFEAQATDEARLSMLRSHIAEVSARMRPDTAGDGRSQGYGSLASYLAQLNARRQELEQALGLASSTPTMAVAKLRW